MLIDRADSRNISDKRNIVLSMYGLEQDHLLGSGSESEVYDYSENQVLKIYADEARIHQLNILKSFYNHINASKLSFALPCIESITAIENLLVVIETKIPGKTLAEALKTCSKRDRDFLSDLYFKTVKEVASILIFPTPERFSLFDESSLMASFNFDWNFFIKTKIIEKVSSIKDIFDIHWPSYQSKVDKLLDLFSAPFNEELALVHGDIFPENILVNDELKVTGLLDFGMFTMYGDPIFDLAIAWATHTMYSDNDTKARESLLPKALEKIDKDNYPRFWGYVMAYAILSCTSWVGENEEVGKNGHFLWALDILLNSDYWENIAI